MYKCCCLSRLVSNIVDCIIFSFTFCLVSMDGQFTFVLGTQDSTRWNENPGTNPSISYSNAEKQVQMELVCSPDTADTLIALGEDPINTYKFQLIGKCSCWNGCSGELFCENFFLVISHIFI